MPSKLLIVTALLVAVAGCTAQADVDPDLVGTWVGTTGDIAGFTIEFAQGGDFIFYAPDEYRVGTYEADGSTLTMSFPDEGPICTGGTMTLAYDISGRTLTVDVMAATCVRRGNHWTLERISA